MKESFSTRLARALTLKKIKPATLAEKTGLPKSGISQYLKGTCKPKDNNVRKIADALDINADWLTGYSVYMDKPKTQEEKQSSAIVFIYGSIPAGVPMELIEDVVDTEEIPAEMLKGGKEYFGLLIKGDSMYPEYREGDIIICQKVQDCENGDECVVMINGNEGTFKKVLKNEKGIILQPLNPDYQPIIYTNEEINNLPVRVIGKVVQLRRNK